jgi:multiple sugar transport system substrate-binding protein
MSRPDEREIRDLAQQLSAGRLSRREFVARASLLGLSMGAIGSIVAACGGEEAAPPAEAPPAEAPPAEAPPAEAPPAEAPPAEAPPAGPTGASDEIAVEAAKQFSGTTINITWESGLQANDPKLVWAAEWEELTGIKINVIELDNAALYTKGLEEHIAGSGAHDIVNILPAWIPDFVAAGAIVPIDEWAAKYLNPADLEDFHPLYKGMPIWQGQNYGFFDDGDVFLLYYRKDIFEELGLEPPATYDDWIAIAQQITDAKAPEVYGADFWRNPTFQQWAFLPMFQGQGGVPFAPETLEPQINNELGVQVLEQILALNKTAAPGVEAPSHDPVAVLTSWLQGSTASMYWWPPPGRWSAGYGGAGEAGFDFVAESTVVDKVGYAPMPGGGWHAAGFVLSIAANSPNQEAAYLTTQWITSPRVSLKRVTQPIALRDPYRLSHYSSEEYRGLWADAGAYLDALKQAANVAFTDWAIPGGQEYFLAIDKAVTATMGGQDPQSALDTAVSEFNSITDRLGRDKQIEFWNAYLQTPGSSPSTTIEALGQAV